jgi:hypothetical protein
MSASRNLEIALKNAKGASDRPEFDTPKKIQDILTSFPDTYRTTERYYLEDANIVQTAPAFGSTIQYEIKDTDMMVGNFMLDIVVANAGTTCLAAEGWVANLLNRVETRLGGQRLTWYSGETLRNALMLENTSVESKKAIASMFGSGNTVGAGEITQLQYCVPLICPGSKGLINNPMNIDQKVLFPVGMAGQSLMFYLTLGAKADVDPASKITVTSITLRYNRARIQNKAMIPSSTSGLKKALYSFVFPYFQEDAYLISVSSGVQYTQDIKSVITQGELQCLMVSKSTLAKYSAAKSNFEGYEMKKITLRVEGNDTWAVNSTYEYNLKNLMLNKTTFETYKGDGTALGYIYTIPISPNYTYDFFNFGSPGVNFNQSNIQLITDTNANTEVQKLYVCAIYKGVIHVYDNKSAEIKYDFSSPY